MMAGCAETADDAGTMGAAYARTLPFGEMVSGCLGRTEPCIAVVIKAYFDKTGDQAGRSKSLVAAGFAAYQPRWDLFEKRWARVLDAFGADFYHSASLEDAAEKGRDGWTFERLSAMREQLWKAIDSTSLREHMYACVIFRDAYDHMNARYELAEHGLGMYALACLGVMPLAYQRLGMTTKAAQSRMLLYFEKGDTGQDEFLDFWKAENINQSAPIPLDHKYIDNGRVSYIRQFEVADLLAYEVRHAWEGTRPRGVTGPRRQLAELFENAQDRFVVHQELARLRECCALWAAHGKLRARA
jgi:hypothetical protein